jgi:hypothetical protein
VCLHAEAAGESQIVELGTNEIDAFEMLLLRLGQAEAAATKF